MVSNELRATDTSLFSGIIPIISSKNSKKCLLNALKIADLSKNPESIIIYSIYNYTTHNKREFFISIVAIIIYSREEYFTYLYTGNTGLYVGACAGLLLYVGTPGLYVGGCCCWAICGGDICG